MPEQPFNQQEYLAKAKKKLKFSWPQFAARMNTPFPTFKKWYMSSESSENVREMSSTAIGFVQEIIAHEALKVKCAKLEQRLKELEKIA